MDKIKTLLSKKVKHSFSSQNVHRWIVPLLYAVLWAAALIFAQNVTDFFPTENEGIIEVIQFSVIFVTLFLEILIMLIDIYVSNKANYLAPVFILFAVLLLAILLGTAVSIGVAAVKNIVDALPWVLVFSSTLKLIENLLINNTHWYIVTIPKKFDARGIYINHPLGR